jgi:hypothetical protein
VTRVFAFDDYVADMEMRKRELGIDEADDAIEALRNKGGGRTPEKKAFLSRIAERAERAGRRPVISH